MLPSGRDLTCIDSEGSIDPQASKVHPERGEPYYAMAQIQYDIGHLDRAEQASRLAPESDTSMIPEVHLLLVKINRWRGEKAKLALEL